MSSHTFCLMQMCLSTVWHSHYLVWCEGTINVMFTLKTLLGCVYVKLLTYEDVSVCISLTWSSRMHTNVQLKTRSHICVHVFLTKTYLYASFVIWDSCMYHVLSHYFDRKECFYTTFDIQCSVFEKYFVLTDVSARKFFDKEGEDQSEHSILSRDLSPIKTSCSNTR